MPSKMRDQPTTLISATLMDGVIVPPTLRTSVPAPLVFFSMSNMLPEIMRDLMGLSNSPFFMVNALRASTEKSPEMEFAV